MRELEVKAKMTGREHRSALLRDEFTDRLESFTNNDGNTVNVGTINTLIDLCQSQYEEVVYCIDPESEKKENDLTYLLRAMMGMHQVLWQHKVLLKV